MRTCGSNFLSADAVTGPTRSKRLNLVATTPASSSTACPRHSILSNSSRRNSLRKAGQEQEEECQLADFETPELKKNLITPKIEPGVMSHLAPFVAKPEIQKPLGYPGELIDNWEQVAVDKLGELKGKYLYRFFWMPA